MKLEKLFGNTNAVLKITVETNEKLTVSGGAMVSMTDTFSVKLKSGGFKKAFGRAFSSQSVFLQEYVAKSEGEVTLSPSFLGDIVFLEMDGSKAYKLGQRAFLAATGNIELNTKNAGGKGILSGEGLFQVEASGTGTLCLCSYGAIVKKELEVGERFIVDTNHVVLRDANLQYKVEMISDGLTSFIGGEGYVMKLCGPGTIWYQTKNPSYLVSPGS